MAKLRIVDGPQAGAEFPLEEGESEIGRQPECRISLPDPKASRSHAKLTLGADGRCLVQDLGSSNGTFLNGSPLKPRSPRPLSGGDELRVGRNLFRFFADPAPSELEIPGYELEDILAEGGMGTIFRASERETGRAAAVKILHREQAENSEFVERFIQEARAAARLSHPNIVKVHNVGKTNNGRYYYTMELVRGTSLAQHIGELPAPEAARMFLEVADALEHAHRHGIIHRDIKPDNILVDQDGEPKLTDLGIAILDKSDMTGSGSGQVLGTPHYMSPEQAAGRDITPSTDIYSLGATFYHVFSGRPPLDGETAEEIMIKQVREIPPPLAAAAEDIPPELARVVDRALAKSPGDRQPDAAALRDDIARAIRKAYSETGAGWRLRTGPAALLAAVLAAAALLIAWLVRD
ncbi:MAG: protein kinase [Planctomycetota bacterium]|jgi:serine/threonine-protein kinase|nr:protein kinase [Planctomycetota bacterium]